MRSPPSDKLNVVEANSLVVRGLEGGARLFAKSEDQALIGLPSKQCFSLPFTSRVKTAVASLHYQLESEIPLDAESMSSELCTGQDGLVVLTDGAHIAQIFRAEEVITKHLLAVTPLAFLAVQPYVNPRVDHQLFAVSLGENVDLLRFENGKLREWRWVNYSRKVVIESLSSMVAEGEASETNVVCDASDELLEWVHATIPSVQCRGTTEASIRLQAIKVLEGMELPLVNLRNGPLRMVDPLGPVRRYLALGTGAAIILLGLMAAGFYWRAYKYQLRAAELVVKQESVFREVFPNQVIPVGILSRIESEHRRLSATKGTEGTGVPNVGNVLPVMQAFWEAAPTDIRFRVDMLHFTPKLIRKLDGSARSYEDLDVLRESLLRKGFKVPPISSSQSGKGVSLQLDQIPWEPLVRKGTSE